MHRPTLILGLTLGLAAIAHADDAGWPPERREETTFTERKLEIYEHGSRAEWGYERPQRDSFFVLHPREPRERPPLYVVLHSAGHDVRSCLECTKTVGNHDIYHAPPDHLALYLDCRANKGDWWWGAQKHAGPEPGPTEKRVIATVKWVVERYGVDADRVYLCGNSMGGSGTLGIGMRHGDVFAAIKANVPAEVKHVSSRMYFPPLAPPADVVIPDPPIVVDYSAPNDDWSRGHEGFIQAMRDRKYALFMYWGPFGHANDHAKIERLNDLVNSFDWLAVKKNELYPVFTNASTDDAPPWPDRRADQAAGQINAFFRWTVARDANDGVELKLFLVTPQTLTTKFAIPQESTANVTLRRLQSFRVAPGAKLRWAFGDATGEVSADAAGLVTIPRLVVTAAPQSLTLRPGE